MKLNRLILKLHLYFFASFALNSLLAETSDLIIVRFESDTAAQMHLSMRDGVLSSNQDAKRNSSAVKSLSTNHQYPSLPKEVLRIRPFNSGQRTIEELKAKITSTIGVNPHKPQTK